MRPRPLSSFWLAVVLSAVLLLSLPACQAATPQPEEAPAPTAALGYPAPAEPESPAGLQPYPPSGEPPAAADSGPAAGLESGYPSGLMAGPAVENASQLTARLLSSAPDADLPGTTRLHVMVLTVQDLPGMPSFTRDLANQEVDLYASTNDLANLAAGDSFAAEVTYRGDEHGGKFFVKNMTRINP